MAFTLTNRGGTVDTTDLDTYTLDPTSDLTASKLQCLFMHCFDNTSSQPPSPSVTGNGITYTEIRSQDVDNAGADRSTMFLFAGSPTGTLTGNITVDFPFTGGNLANALAWGLVEIDGADLSGGVANAFVAANTVGATSAAATSVSVNYGATPTAGNLLLAGYSWQLSAAGGTPRTNWTEIHDMGAGSTAMATEYRDTNVETETAASGSFGSSRCGIIAVEVKAAAAAATSSPVFRRDPHRGLYMR